MRLDRWSWALVGYALACGGDPPDGLLVRFTSAREIPSQADGLEVVTSVADTAVELDRRVYRLEGIGAFPAEVFLVPGATTPDQVVVSGRLFRGRTIVAVGEADATIPASGSGQLDIPLVESNAGACGTILLLRDDFEDGVPLPGWESFSVGSGNGVINESGGVVSMEPPPDGELGYRSRLAYDARGGSLVAEVQALPAGVNHARLDLVSSDDSSRWSIEYYLDFLSFIRVDAGVAAEVGEPLASNRNVNAHPFWQLAASDTEIAWLTSVDGQSWTTRGTSPAPSWISDARARLLIAVDDGNTPGFVIWRGVNERAPVTGWCSTSVIVDDFDDGVIEPTWTAVDTSGCQRTEASGRLTIDLATGGSCGLRTPTQYDLRGSAIAIDVAAAPAGAELVLDVLGAGEVGLRFAGSSAGLTFASIAGGDPLVVSTAAFDPVADRHWRIRERAGEIFWETSRDGRHFAIRERAAAPFVPDAVEVQVRLDAPNSITSHAEVGGVNTGAP